MKDLTRLTLEERVGQLFFVGFQGTRLDAETGAVLDRIRPGGIVCMRRNIDSLEQIYEMNLQLQEKAEVPLFLAMGQEGGAIDRLKHVLKPMPPLSDLADLGVTSLRVGARLIASELEASGFNTNLAPVLDLGLPGSVVRERTLAAGPTEVCRFGRPIAEEFAKKKILACGRHFPGLGGARRDPHFVLPKIERSRRQLLTEDVVPFHALAEQLDMILVSHGHYPTLGDIRPQPASLSQRIVGGLLRRTVGFEGIIMTDDLTMGAVTSTGLNCETFLRAVRAGNDMILFGQTTPLVEEAFGLIVETARSDRKLRSQIDASVERIFHVKKGIGFVPLHNRALLRTRLVRQIDRLKQSVPSVDRVRVP